MRRSPATLWRHILADVFRLLVLSATVLVSVIALAATLKPLADGQLQPGDALLFAFLAVPPMLAYALPFAGGFASTLVYQRLAQDNETTAVYAGGVSHRTLLVPALVIGLGASALVAALNEQFIPRFLRGMQELVSADLTRILAQGFDRGRAVEFDGMMVLADKALVLDAPPQESGITAQMALFKMVALRLDDQGRPSAEVTARLATLWLLPGDRDAGTDMSAITGYREASQAVMRLEDVVLRQRGRAMVRSEELPLAWSMEGVFLDKPKFLSWRELRALDATPERMNWVDRLRRGLAFKIAANDAAATFARALSGEGRARMADGEGNAVVVRAAHLDRDPAGWSIVPQADGLVEVELLRVGSSPRPGEVTRFRGSRAVLTAEEPAGPGGTDLRFRVDLYAKTAQESEERRVFSRGGLSQPDDSLDRLLKRSSGELLTDATPYLAGAMTDPLVQTSVDQLSGSISQLQRKVLAVRHERLALAASCFVMVMTGAVTALRFAKRLPLTVYLWTFLPAVLCIMTIGGGQQMVSGQGPHGLALLWSGVVLLAAYTLIVYRSVARR